MIKEVNQTLVTYTCDILGINIGTFPSNQTPPELDYLDEDYCISKQAAQGISKGLYPWIKDIIYYCRIKNRRRYPLDETIAKIHSGTWILSKFHNKNFNQFFEVPDIFSSPKEKMSEISKAIKSEYANKMSFILSNSTGDNVFDLMIANFFVFHDGNFISHYKIMCGYNH